MQDPRYYGYGPVEFYLQPTRYVSEEVPVRCDDLSAAPAVSDGAAPAALPFAFPYFGGAVDHVLYGDGALTLLAGTDVRVADAGSDTDLPLRDAPTGQVLAYAARLFREYGLSAVRAQTLGTAPARRFVVQWSDFSHAYDRDARFTFQAQLYEGTGVIEFHYCAMRQGPRPAPGAELGQAVMGVEAPDGVRFWQRPRGPGALASGSALRLRPVP